MSWSCPRCETINSDSMEICEVCDCNKPIVPAIVSTDIPKLSSPSNSSWWFILAYITVFAICALGVISIIGGQIVLGRSPDTDSGNQDPPDENLSTAQSPSNISVVVDRSEVNSSSALGRFHIGLDGVNDSCEVVLQRDTFSQEDLLRYEYVYIAATFNDDLIGQKVYWSVFDIYGTILYNNIERELDNESNNCFWQGFELTPDTAPGEYVVEVTLNEEIIYREVFKITHSDLSQIPRPSRDPFGVISFGRDGVDTESCTVGIQSDVFNLSDVNNDPWFYFASPFQLGEVGKVIYWSVYKPNGDRLYDKIERVIEDDIDLCFWQGFSLENELAGRYTILIEDAQNNVLFSMVFELR